MVMVGHYFTRNEQISRGCIKSNIFSPIFIDTQRYLDLLWSHNTILFDYFHICSIKFVPVNPIILYCLCSILELIEYLSNKMHYFQKLNLLIVVYNAYFFIFANSFHLFHVLLFLHAAYLFHHIRIRICAHIRVQLFGITNDLVDFRPCLNAVRLSDLLDIVRVIATYSTFERQSRVT